MAPFADFCSLLMSFHSYLNHGLLSVFPVVPFGSLSIFKTADLYLGFLRKILANFCSPLNGPRFPVCLFTDFLLQTGPSEY